jgi:hypothetical protein
MIRVWQRLTSNLPRPCLGSEYSSLQIRLSRKSYHSPILRVVFLDFSIAKKDLRRIAEGLQQIQTLTNQLLITNQTLPPGPPRIDAFLLTRSPNILNEPPAPFEALSCPA